MDINDCREQIDILDKEILKLFSRRMDICAEIAMIKKENSEDIYCAERETQIIKRVQKISDPRITQYAEKLFILIMQLSKDYQKKIIKTKGDNP